MYSSFLVIDQYSVASYFMAALCGIALFLLLTMFQARYRTKPAPKAKKSQRRMEQDEVANRVTWCNLSVYNAALLGCMLLNVSTKGSIGSFETMGISFAESHFGLQPAVAGTIVAVNGMIGVCSLLSMGYLGMFLTDIQMILGGITVCAVGIVSFSGLKSVEMGADNSIYHYIFGIFLIYGVGYPIGHTAVIGLFSKGEYRCVWEELSLRVTQACLTRWICSLLFTSCWEKTARYSTGLVCLCWFVG